MSHELRYHPNAEQLALASTFNESLEALLPLARLHRSAQESDETWSSVESLGLFGIGVSEEAGGSGLGAAEEVLIAMELGRRLASPSIIATIGATHATAKDTPGRRTAAAYRRDGRIILVADSKADLVLVRAGDETALYEPNFESKPLEERLWLAELRQSSAGPRVVATFEAAGLLRLRLIDAAYLSGIAEAALTMGVAYAGERKQFGRAIGSFQAIKHHCANMAIAARRARDQASFAAIAFDDAREDAALQVDCALFVAAEAALENAGKNIQIHGGIGFSDEADPHLFLKRAQLSIALAGGLEAANARIAAHAVTVRPPHRLRSSPSRQ